ncbi:DUF3078 domain-containing protein [bacterium]|nr:DUF3078 domain-containing protein [bacterium]
MKKLLITVILLTTNLVFGQEQTNESIWKNGGALSSNFTQVNLKNWSGGGDDALSLSNFLTLFANYKKNKISWDNNLEFGYGILRQGENSTKKSDDKIALNSKFSREAITNWSYAGLLDFRTQFANGFDYKQDPKGVKVSEFMAPAYLTLALGGEYKPNETFFIFASPVTGKATIVLDKKLSDAESFGVKSGEKVKNEFGAYLNSAFKKTVWENVDFQTKANFFVDYTDPFLDISWETSLLMKVNKYVTTTFSTHLVYDNNVKDKKGDTAIQFKEVLAVGLLYKF